MKEIFEKTLIDTMLHANMTMSDAMFFHMENDGIDVEDVFEMTDYLENKFDQDMNKVEYYMKIMTGIQPDIILY